ncbi:MAG TPA: methyltransferase domain-containing protein [Gemmatimonadales bacterium]
MTGPFSVRDYWESRLRQSYSLEGVGYRRLGHQYNHWMYRVRAGVFTRVAGSLGVDWRRAAACDIGSGTGFYVDQWHRLGVTRVTGVDITDKAVEELGRRFPGDEFVREDVGRDWSLAPRLPAHAFDVVSAMDVLFHLVDDADYARAFVNIASLLTPGGWFLWSDNFLRHRTERVTHQVSRTLTESERLVRAAGFEIVRRVPMFVVMNYPADTRGKVARWAWTAMVAPAALAEPLGWAVGAILAPIDRWLTRWMSESPTTEIMVCRKGR